MPVSRFTYTFVKAGLLKMQLKYGLGERVILEYNKSKIPDADLLKILRFVSQNKKRIIEQWNKHFGV